MLKVRLYYVPLKLSHSNFNLVISKPYRTYPNEKFGFENMWLNTLRCVVGHFNSNSVCVHIDLYILYFHSLFNSFTNAFFFFWMGLSIIRVLTNVLDCFT